MVASFEGWRSSKDAKDAKNAKGEEVASFVAAFIARGPLPARATPTPNARGHA